MFIDTDGFKIIGLCILFFLLIYFMSGFIGFYAGTTENMKKYCLSQETMIQYKECKDNFWEYVNK